jgi:Protein of unknown function (DUF3300)
MRKLLSGLLITCLVVVTTNVFGQAPAARGSEPVVMNEADLDKLVGPIALYPDDLIAIILPSSTFPLEIVQADRFLDRRKTDKNLPVNEAWHEPIKALLNYPEVVKKMSTELDWSVALGEAVVADQSAVLLAVQRFRRQTQSAGNLKTDDKQTVVVEKEVIKIVPSNPEVIYVPQYNPSTVVVSSPYPVYGYAPAPYPVYYYPYAPGAAFATGLVWGAAITAAWGGGRYEANYSGGNNTININREQSVNRGDVNRSNIQNRSASRSTSQSTAWKSDKRPGQVSGSSPRASTQRAGDLSSRAGGGAVGAGGDRQVASQRTAARTQASPNPAGSQGRGGDAFSGYGSARDAQANSARGAASRQSMSAGQSHGSQAGSAGRGGGGSPGGGRSFGGGGGRGGRR